MQNVVFFSTDIDKEDNDLIKNNELYILQPDTPFKFHNYDLEQKDIKLFNILMKNFESTTFKNNNFSFAIYFNRNSFFINTEKNNIKINEKQILTNQKIKLFFDDKIAFGNFPETDEKSLRYPPVLQIASSLAVLKERSLEA